MLAPAHAFFPRERCPGAYVTVGNACQEFFCQDYQGIRADISGTNEIKAFGRMRTFRGYPVKEQCLQGVQQDIP